MTESSADLSPLISAAESFYRFGWLLGTSGNLSRRVDDDTFVISASGRDKGALTEADFLTVNLDGEVLSAGDGDRPSAETAIHRVIYQRLPAVGAVYHVHDPYAALVSRRDGPEKKTTFLRWEMIKGLDIWDRDGASIEIFPNHRKVDQIARDIEARIEGLEVPGVCIEGHGVYAWGTTPEAAKRHVETFAYLFRVSWEESVR